MRLLVLAIASSLPAVAGAAALQGPATAKGAIARSPQECPRAAGHYAYTPGEPLRPRKLGELPPANAYASVLRLVGRCQVPVVVKYGVGRR